MSTLEVKMVRHQESLQKVSKWLTHMVVSKENHPRLEESFVRKISEERTNGEKC